MSVESRPEAKAHDVFPGRNRNLAMLGVAVVMLAIFLFAWWVNVAG